MDPIVHTIIALVWTAAAYYLGRRTSRTALVDVIEVLLLKLEKDGFVVTKLDENGEKELVAVSEVVAKTLKESNKTS